MRIEDTSLFQTQLVEQSGELSLKETEISKAKRDVIRRFTNTLCMDSLYIAHPLLEGVDGIILLTDGTILASVNERNAIVAVAPDKNVEDVF